MTQFPDATATNLSNRGDKFSEFSCPACLTPLEVFKDQDAEREDSRFSCNRCHKSFRSIHGIPDFRLFEDPYLNYDEDRARTDKVIEQLGERDFLSLLEYYWSLSDVTPNALRSKFIRSASVGEDKAKHTIELLKKSSNPVRVLEIGCGTGNFLVQAVNEFPEVVGLDIAMRWLHLSRRRFMDKNLKNPLMVCGCGEYLPFPDASFDAVVISATLEFAKDQQNMIAEVARVLNPGGALYVNTVNRFSFATNPYVYLWGIGFLPRSLQASYVRFRKNASYENVRLLSFNELERLAQKYFKKQEYLLPDVSNHTLSQFPWTTRLQVRLYRALKTLPLLAFALKQIGPGWEALLSLPVSPNHRQQKQS